VRGFGNAAVRRAAIIAMTAASGSALLIGSPASGQTTRDPIATHVTEAARRFGIPESWIYAVMKVESAGDISATSVKGAMGLMQVMPATYAALKSRYGLGPNAYQPRDNILAGAAYLREMYDRYGAPGFLAAYNAGPGRYEQSLGGRALPVETRAYLARFSPSVGVQTGQAVEPPDPFAWRRAALFAGRWGEQEPVDRSTQTLASADAPTAVSTAQLPRLSPPTVSLFVSLSGERR
jgi:soluble lytic murein transglycosylase-like protein